MENELFDLAVQAALRVPPKNVIGTKTEHCIHAALKYYFQPCDTFHEIKLDGFICDATDVNQNEVFEIQTKAFDKLRKKLEILLASHPVTVIHPIITEKRLITIYDADGQTTVRKSPKKHSLAETAEQLNKIKSYLSNPNLHIVFAFLKVDETRIFSGSKDARKPFQKPVSVQKVPTELLKTENVVYPDFYISLLPDSLQESFTSSDLATQSGISRSDAQYLLYLLNELGFVKRTDRDKRGYIYVRANP